MVASQADTEKARFQDALLRHAKPPPDHSIVLPSPAGMLTAMVNG